MSVINEIAAERKRQIEQEGWTPEHDDEHKYFEMARAAVCYAFGAYQSIITKKPALHEYWPKEWDKAWWKPTTPRRDLIKAAALIVAEIERLDRMAAA